jgi:hypothetical protein
MEGRDKKHRGSREFMKLSQEENCNQQYGNGKPRK